MVHTVHMAHTATSSMNGHEIIITITLVICCLPLCSCSHSRMQLLLQCVRVWFCCFYFAVHMVAHNTVTVVYISFGFSFCQTAITRCLLCDNRTRKRMTLTNMVLINMSRKFLFCYDIVFMALIDRLLDLIRVGGSTINLHHLLSNWWAIWIWIEMIWNDRKHQIMRPWLYSLYYIEDYRGLKLTHTYFGFLFSSFLAILADMISLLVKG